MIKAATNADVAIEPGGRGEFTVWVNGQKVAEKSRSGFPSDSALLESVKKAMA